MAKNIECGMSLKRLLKYLSSQKKKGQILLPSGVQFLFENRVGWSRTHLQKAGLLQAPKRSFVQITNEGQRVLAEKPSRIDVNFLKRYPSFVAFIRPNSTSAHGTEKEKPSFTPSTEENASTPEEMLESSFYKLRTSLASDLIQNVKQCSPAFFEKLVVELLVRMGYGGTIKDAGEATRLTNDEGIDGIIKEDKLGLDVIYIQAKRWENNVGRPEIQSFVGALEGKRANKGVFITTSSFGNTALEYVKSISKKVILIDGEQLAEYMIDYGLGVATRRTFDLKRIDNDYFDE